MTFEQLIAILRARWLIALSTFVLILGSVTTATLLWPKTYTAYGSVVVDIKSPDPIAGMVLAGQFAMVTLGTNCSPSSSQSPFFASRPYTFIGESLWRARNAADE